MIPMGRFLLIAWIITTSIFSHASAQPRIKGKRLDTTQPVFGDDTTVKRLLDFKDSLTTVGPKKEDPRELKESDPTSMIILILGSVFVIVWAGRRAWRRRRNS